MEENQQINNPPQMDSEGNDPQDNLVTESHEGKKQMGPLMGIVIIIAILVFGGLYFWGARINNIETEEENIPLILGDDGSSLLPVDSNAEDTPENIEADFDTTDLDALEAQLGEDLSAIEFELQ
jgi:hypothetical protein